jgi:hypothetical protein
VHVREDLDRQGPEAAERHLIDDNLERRQLGNVAIARCLKRMIELEKVRTREGRGGQRGQGDLRDVVAKRVKWTGRTLSRYMNALKLPLPLQEAVDTRRLKLITAETLAGLKASIVEEVASAVAAGENPNIAAAKALPRKTGKHVRTIEAAASMFKNINKSLFDMDGRWEELKAISAYDRQASMSLCSHLKDLVDRLPDDQPSDKLSPALQELVASDRSRERKLQPMK